MVLLIRKCVFFLNLKTSKFKNISWSYCIETLSVVWANTNSYYQKKLEACIETLCRQDVCGVNSRIVF